MITLKEVNEKWITFKDRQGLVCDLEIRELIADAPKGVEASFDLQELMEDRLVLHLSDQLALYRQDYVDFILHHEFTHFYDFYSCPYDKNRQEDFFAYMNSYSEFHASRLSLADLLRTDISCRTFMGSPAGAGPGLPMTIMDRENLVPRPDGTGSIRQMLNHCFGRARAGFEKFRDLSIPQIFQFCFKQVMYVFGYVSLFEESQVMVRNVCQELGLTEDLYIRLYQALLISDTEGILAAAKAIYEEAYVPFVKAFAGKGGKPEEEGADYWEMVGGDSGDWNWGGRSRANVGVRQKFKGFRRGRNNTPVKSVEDLKREIGLK